MSRLRLKVLGDGVLSPVFLVLEDIQVVAEMVQVRASDATAVRGQADLIVSRVNAFPGVCDLLRQMVALAEEYGWAEHPTTVAAGAVLREAEVLGIHGGRTPTR